MSRKKPGVTLTDMQRAFCYEYIIDLNATNAAIRAGYSEASARSTASHLLDEPDVQAFVQKLQEDKFLRLRITADEVMAELARIGYASIEDFVDEEELPEEKIVQPEQPLEGEPAPASPKPRAALNYRKVTVDKRTGAKTTITFNLQQKIAALKLMAMHLGLFDKKKRHGKDDLVVILPERLKKKNLPV